MSDSKVGRPTKYNASFPEQLRRVAKLCEGGLTDEAIAEFFEVTRVTVANWKNEHPEFFDTIKEVKKGPDDEMERSLFERGKGYQHPEDKIFVHNGVPVIVPTIKHYPPDTAAAFIWLKNRRPEKWRDKHEIEHSGELHVHFDAAAEDV